MAGVGSKTSGGARVLVVEDEPDIRELVQMTLAAAGYDAVAVADGPAALQQARELAPDLVVLDLGLPGMEGSEVLGRLRIDRATREVPVIVLTARLDAGSEREVMALGASEFLVKPFKRQELVERVDALLAAHRPVKRKRLGLF